MPDVFLLRAPVGAGGTFRWYLAYFAACALLVVTAGCFNPVYEEGIACSEARACPPGMVCDALDNRCRIQPLCADGEQNGDETGEDCGGSCPACPAGQPCGQPGECQSGVCADFVCAAPACGDGVINHADEVCDEGGESAACNANCTLAQCGDSVTNQAADEQCDGGGESASCNSDCTLAQCGDGKVNGAAREACDDGADSATCDGDCTIAECGDGYVNVVAGEQCDGGPMCNPDCTLVIVCGNGVVDPGEDCDLGTSNNDHGRCGSRCFWGAGLDGSFGATWEMLAPSSGSLYALVSFHYSGTRYIHDFRANQRYEPATNAWSPAPAALPFISNWADAAVAPDSLWVPRNGAMYRYDLASATWSTHATGIPDGGVQLTAAVFDGDGYIWYHGPGNDLVRYDPGTGSTLSLTHPSGDMFETRVAYDPVTNSVVFTGFLNNTFTIYDIDTGAFSLSSPSPGGRVHDNTCQDRSGNIYTGATSYASIYRYNVAENLWTVLDPLPFDHDNHSTCVVSQDGYLYYASGTSFARLPLGVH